jgi:hypothetical protein
MKPSSAPSGQRGSAALIVVMLLLFSAALVALYLNRNLLVDQRNSANQMRTTLALEAAEAGIEWATAMVNSPDLIDADCKPLNTAASSFRKRYVTTGMPAVSGVTTVLNSFPGCRLTANGLSCSCPPAGSTAQLGTIEDPSFSVTFADVPSQPDAVQVTSRGCTAARDACNPNTFKAADATARVTAVLKLKRMQVPASPFVCGRDCNIKSSYTIINTSVPTNGVLINAGRNVDISNGNIVLQSLQGVPVRNAIVAGDETLASLASSDPNCSKSAMFQNYFGKSIESYRTDPTTKQLNCGPASDCESKLNDAYKAGWRAFYFNSELKLSGGGTFGSADEPVMLVTPNAMDIRGNWDIYGLMFSNNADVNGDGSGSATVHGAQIACADYHNNGNGTTIYDPQVMANLQRQMGAMARVPGSWRDF